MDEIVMGASLVRAWSPEIGPIESIPPRGHLWAVRPPNPPRRVTARLWEAKGEIISRRYRCRGAVAGA